MPCYNTCKGDTNKRTIQEDKETAKATATCRCERCGQTFTKMATKYSRREADEWTAWAEKHYTVCADCWKAEQKASAMDNIFTLPELTGSEKQIAWATDIRAKMLNSLFVGRTPNEKGIANMNMALAKVTDAKWWIDRRSLSTMQIANEMMQMVIVG